MPTIPENWFDRYGLPGFAILVFASVISYLFRLYSSIQNDRITKLEAEKKEWMDEKLKKTLDVERLQMQVDNERTELRAEYDAKVRDYAEAAKRDARELLENAQAREDQVRREFAELMETVSERTTRVTEQNTAVLQKIYERFVGPRSRRF
jgi:hypothetical protein